MKYFKLLYDYENDKNYINCSKSNMDGDEYIVSSGKYIKEWNPVIFEYNVSEGSVLTDYVANLHRWLIASDKFCELIKKVVPSSGIQFLPIKILEKSSGTQIETFKVINILNCIDAFDLEHSRYDIFELDDEKVILVEKYALKKECIIGHDIFRLKNDEIPIFVSENIKNIVEEYKLLGFDFVEVPVY